MTEPEIQAPEVETGDAAETFVARYNLTKATMEPLELAKSLSTTISAVAVKSNDDYEKSTAQLKDIKAASKKLEEAKKAMLAPFNEVVTKIRAMFKAPEDALANAEAHLKRSALTYYTEQERLRKEQERLQQEAIRKAEEAARERARLEAQRQAEEEAAKAAAPSAAEDDEWAVPSMEEPAAPAPIVGEVMPVEVAIPMVIIAPPKASGISVRKKWICKIVDPALIPREYMMPNEKALEAYAQSMKENAKLPGCEFEEVSSMAAGKGRS